MKRYALILAVALLLAACGEAKREDPGIPKFLPIEPVDVFREAKVIEDPYFPLEGIGFGAVTIESALPMMKDEEGNPRTFVTGAWFMATQDIKKGDRVLTFSYYLKTHKEGKKDETRFAVLDPRFEGLRGELQQLLMSPSNGMYHHPPPATDAEPDPDEEEDPDEADPNANSAPE